MKNKNDQQLRSILQKKFRDLEIREDDLRWEDIEPRLTSTSSRPAYLYYAIGTAACLLIIVTAALVFRTSPTGSESMAEQIPGEELRVLPPPTLADNDNIETDGHGVRVESSSGNEAENQENTSPPADAVSDQGNDRVSTDPAAPLQQINGDGLLSFYAEVETIALAGPEPGSQKPEVDNHLPPAGAMHTVPNHRGVNPIERGIQNNNRNPFSALHRVSLNVKPLINFHIINPVTDDFTFIRDTKLPSPFTKERFGFSSSASFDFNLGKRLYLNTGVSYTYRKQSVEYDFTDYLTQENGSIRIDDTVRNMGIFLGLKRRLTSTESIVHYLNGGIELQHRLNSPRNTSNNSYVLHLGYEVEYPAGSSYSVSIQPKYSYQLSDFNYMDLNTRSYWIGLQISVNKLFRYGSHK